MFGLSVVFLLKCIRNDHCFKVIQKSINSFVFSGKCLSCKTSFIIESFFISEPWVHQRMKHGPALYLYRNSNHPFHDGSKVVIYPPSSTIECVTMHWIYFSCVQNFSPLIANLFFYFNRKCSSTIQYDAYQLNNALLILISNNSIRKIYLYRLPLLYLWSKKEPSDRIYIYVSVITSDIFFSFFLSQLIYVLIFLYKTNSFLSLSLSSMSSI